MSWQDDHFLLILCDSQLPIGSFAYSSGLESASIHDAHINVPDFLHHSLHSTAHTTLPFLVSAYRDPSRAGIVDDEFDANVPCAVARRASTAQGRALLKLIDKTFLHHLQPDHEEDIYEHVKRYRASVVSSKGVASGHYGVVFGLAGRVLDIELDRLMFAFLQAHAKAVLSAAVRLSLIGPYESTHILSSKNTRDVIVKAVEKCRDLTVEESGQTFGLIDIWQGRHELLYSRIFSA